MPGLLIIMFLRFFPTITLYLGNWKGFLKNPNTLELCPLINKVDFIKFWMGDEPQYPPSPSVSLEEATSLTMKEFSNLMTGDPKKACFNLKEEAFPQ